MALTQEQARQNLESLINQYHALSDEQRAGMAEAGVIYDFIVPFLRDVLGWPREQFQFEQHTRAGRPDITFYVEGQDKPPIFVEAKRFGRLEALRPDAQAAGPNDVDALKDYLPPEKISTSSFQDRSDEERQAITYAYANNGQWAILTNFEKLRVFDVKRDRLILAIEKPHGYREGFEELWNLSYHRLRQGGLLNLSNRCVFGAVDPEYLRFINEQRLLLAQDIAAQPDLNAWAFHPDGSINLELLRSVVQRFLDRLVIVRFAEDHLVIPEDTLRRTYEYGRDNPYSPPLASMLETFFRQFDVRHNSMLFARHAVDDAAFSDGVLGSLMQELYKAHYRSMPADIMGNTYEQYLGQTLAPSNGSVTARDNLETRKKQGSYYTPQVLVRYLVDHSLGRYLYGTADGQPDGEPLEGEARRTYDQIGDLRVLDAACGSGSFLIYAYEVLAGFYEREIARLEAGRAARDHELAEMGLSPLERFEELRPQRAAIDHLRQIYPRLILETHLYGVDLDPQAAEIATINLMMRAMERRGQDIRLPMILNQNVKVGNALVGLRPDDPRLAERAEALAALIHLRRRMLDDPDRMTPEEFEQRRENRIKALRERLPEDVRADSRTIYSWRRVLTLEEVHPTFGELQARTDALKAELDEAIAPHFSDVGRARPFHWGAEFPEVFYHDDGTPRENGGFTVVIGNPPWEIVKPDLREFYAQFDERIESKLNRREVEDAIKAIIAEDPRREAQWAAQTAVIEESAAYYRASADFMRQGRGDTATHKLFVERVYGLLADGGRLGYLVPSGIYTDLGTKDLREMLLDEGRIEYVFSFSNERFFFPGVHHSFKFVLLGARKGPRSDGFWAAFRFNPRVAVAPDDLPAFLADRANLVRVENESLRRFSPDSLSLMEFQTQRDYEITERIYDGWPLLGEEIADGWNVKFTAEFHMTNDRDLFHTEAQTRGLSPLLKDLLPLYEGKMIHQFDAFFAEPQYWVEEGPASERLRRKNDTGLDYQQYRLAYRDIAAATNERTLIAAVLPRFVFCNNKAPVIKPVDAVDYEATLLYLEGGLNSLILDFVMRQKMSITLNFFYMATLPLPRLTPGNPYFDAIVERAARLTCTRPEFAALWEEVMGTPWTSPPTPRPPSPSPLVERGPGGEVGVRDEIDALVAHLYGLSRADFDHILGTFPLVFPETPEGRRKRDSLLAEYDAWAGRVAGWARG